MYIQHFFLGIRVNTGKNRECEREGSDARDASPLSTPIWLWQQTITFIYLSLQTHPESKVQRSINPHKIINNRSSHKASSKSINPPTKPSTKKKKPTHLHWLIRGYEKQKQITRTLGELADRVPLAREWCSDYHRGASPRPINKSSPGPAFNAFSHPRARAPTVNFLLRRKFSAPLQHERATMCFSRSTVCVNVLAGALCESFEGGSAAQRRKYWCASLHFRPIEAVCVAHAWSMAFRYSRGSIARRLCGGGRIQFVLEAFDSGE